MKYIELLASYVPTNIVNTLLEDDNQRTYQITHQSRQSHIAQTDVPAAKFSFDIAPVQVVWSHASRRWFGLLTSVFGVVGGTFTTLWMFWSAIEECFLQAKANAQALAV